MAKTKKPSEPVLVLRTCNADMSSHYTKNFIWPKEGLVEAPDWNPDASVECGQGLHGLLWGNGDWSLLSSAVDAVWMIVSVNPDDGLVAGEKKCRFKKGTVIYCGDQAGASTRILCSPEAMTRNFAEAKKANKSSGNYSKAASSGYGSTAASSGYGSTAASSGNYSKAASSGYGSKAASSGNYSKAASSGTAGIAATLGNGGQVQAGKDGLIIATYWDGVAKRYRACVGEVGIDGIKEDTWYEVRNGKLAAVKA